MPSIQASNIVQISLLDGGSFSTADISKLHEGAASNSFRLYDWCFYIFHPESKRHIVWDVGISSDKSAYTPLVLGVQWSSANPVGPQKSLSQQLEDRGVKASWVDTVIFSHAHWDHCRPICEEFPNALGLFGPGTAKYCSPGHLTNGSPTDNSPWDGRFFDLSGHASERWQELSGPWEEFGPFPRAFDYFGDGSFYLIDAPGHMPGNLAAVANIKYGDDQTAWVILASDCCHSRKLLMGEEEIASFDGPGGKMCLHEDVDSAKETIARIRTAEVEYGMHVAMAHDDDWMCAATNEVLLSLLLEKGRDDFLGRVREGKAP